LTLFQQFATHAEGFMAESPGPASGGTAPAKDEVELLEILRLLIKSKKARTTSDLLKYATQYGAPEAEERLRLLEAENIPLDLAFDAVSVQLRLIGQKVGLILPMPPDLAQLFVPIAESSFLLPDEAALHGPMHELAENAIKGSRACRMKAQEMQALVFEAFREGGVLFVDVAVADVLEPKMLPAGIRLIAHLRPHRNPRDVAIQPGSEVSFI
jgi:hypothetical protein